MKKLIIGFTLLTSMASFANTSGASNSMDLSSYSCSVTYRMDGKEDLNGINFILYKNIKAPSSDVATAMANLRGQSLLDTLKRITSSKRLNWQDVRLAEHAESVKYSLCELNK